MQVALLHARLRCQHRRAVQHSAGCSSAQPVFDVLSFSQAAMNAGGVTVVRGSTANTDELSYILQNGKCEALMIQDAEALRKLLPALQDGKVGVCTSLL